MSLLLILICDLKKKWVSLNQGSIHSSVTSRAVLFPFMWVGLGLQEQSEEEAVTSQGSEAVGVWVRAMGTATGGGRCVGRLLSNRMMGKTGSGGMKGRGR